MTERDASVQGSGRWAQVPARAVDDTALRPAALRVLVALATYGNRDGWCWPSIPTIARRLGVRRQSIGRQIRELERLGYLAVKPQARPNGSQSSNLYRVICDADLEADRDRLMEAPPSSVTLLPPQPNCAAPYRTPHMNLKSIRLPAREAEALFARFWEAYPSRGKASNPRKPAYDLFFKKVGQGADAERIIAGAVALAARRAVEIAAESRDGAQFTPQAVTWLRQERWEDELASSTAPVGSGRQFSIAEQQDFLAKHGLQSAGREAVRAKLRELGLEARWPVRQ